MHNPVTTGAIARVWWRAAKKKRVGSTVVLLLTLSNCARFQPTQPALSPSDYSAASMQQSVTLSDTSTRYDPNVLQVGAARSTVLASYGDPNDSRTTDGGLVEEVYAFNPDGTKFVNPQIRARNVALGFFTMGTSVAVRQARLALQERKLTIFHVIYSPDDRIQSAEVEKLSGAPDQLPTQGSTDAAASR
jgi:hypothetical protein